MALLFATSFEMSTISIEASASTTTNFTRATALAGNVSGIASARLNIPTTPAINFLRYTLKAANYAGIGYFRFKLYIATLPSAQTQIGQLQNVANVAMGEVRLNTNGSIALYDSAGTQIGSNSSPLNTAQEYSIEYKHDSTLNPAVMELRLDDVTVASGNGPAQNIWSRFTIGCPTAGGTLDIRYDDLICFDGTGTKNNSWIGKNAVVLISTSSAAGDSNIWKDNAGAAGTTNNWNLVSGLTIQSTTFVESNTLNDLDLYNITDQTIAAADTVNGVITFVRAANITLADATTAVKPVVMKTSGGTQALGPAIIPNNTGFNVNGVSTVLITNALVLENDPDGAAWTNSTINSAQMGLKLTATGTNMIKVSNMWMYIVSTAASVVEQPTLMMMGVGS